MKKTVIFDLDGTLADTSADLIAAANACFQDLGHGNLLDKYADKAVGLLGGRAMLTLGFSRLGEVCDKELDRQYPILLEHYRQNIANETKLYPGAENAVQVLLDEGYLTGICTNKPEELAEMLMQALGVRHMFASLLGADTLPYKKPDPRHFIETVIAAGGDPSKACLVGDTKTDDDTAKAAGVPSILVGFGPEGTAIERLKPTVLLAHYDDLCGHLKTLFG